ncbi:MAG: biopolymer transporter ExbD [Candidatus Accumulibacter sp. UW25]
MIFIITAPLFQQAVPVDLPRVEAGRLDEQPPVVTVAIDAAGVVFVDGVAVERSAPWASAAPCTPRLPPVPSPPLTSCAL